MLIAKALLDIGAATFSVDPPYRLTSGKTSPMYVDIRRVISHPELREAVIAGICEQIQQKDFDVIAGGETAGIPFAAMIAHRLRCPMVYVRKKPKGFGRNVRVEGERVDGQRVVLIEDLSTDGGSKIDFVSAMREDGATCNDAFVVFNYGIFPDRLAEHNIHLQHLVTAHDLLDAAAGGRSVAARTLQEVQAFLSNPVKWQEEHP